MSKIVALCIAIAMYSFACTSSEPVKCPGANWEYNTALCKKHYARGKDNPGIFAWTCCEQKMTEDFDLEKARKECHRNPMKYLSRFTNAKLKYEIDAVLCGRTPINQD